MPHVEIFKTNVKNKRAAREIAFHLSHNLPECEINFDLDDCDNILRVMGSTINVPEVLKSMKLMGYNCEVIH